jgi:hypothetical protein
MTDDIDLAIDKVLLFRLERMDDGVIWIRLCREGGDDKVIYLNSSSAIDASVEDDRVEPWWSTDAGRFLDAKPVAWRTAVKEAIDFIANEYRDPRYDLEGELLPQEARCIHANLVNALAQSDAVETDGSREHGSVNEALALTAKRANKKLGFLKAAAARSALAQSDVEPVAWREALEPFVKAANHLEKCRDDRPLWAALDAGWAQREKVTLTVGDLRRARALYTAPPRLNASAGLIEAAEMAEKESLGWTTNGMIVLQEFARKLRARATDRSWK